MNIPDNITCGMCTYYDYHTDDCTYANNREVDKDGFYIDEPPCRRSQEENAEQSKAGTENNGDLISRSELLKEIEKYKFGAISNDAEREYIKKTILDFIIGQPTAYSVDKVIEDVRCRCYEMGLDESQTEIIVNEIVNHEGGGVDGTME